MDKIEKAVYQKYIMQNKNILETSKELGIPMYRVRDIIVRNRMTKNPYDGTGRSKEYSIAVTEED